MRREINELRALMAFFFAFLVREQRQLFSCCGVCCMCLIYGCIPQIKVCVCVCVWKPFILSMCPIFFASRLQKYEPSRVWRGIPQTVLFDFFGGSFFMKTCFTIIQKTKDTSARFRFLFNSTNGITVSSKPALKNILLNIYKH